MPKSSTSLRRSDLTERSTLLDLLEPLSGNAEVSRTELLTTINERIIPQLVLSHTVDLPVEDDGCATRLPPTEEEIAAFAAIAKAEEVSAALAFIEALAKDGISLEVVLLNLIAPTARLLGEQWLNDDATFTDVTIGLATLQQVVHVLGPNFSVDGGHRGFIVLASPPAEQHTLGIYLLGEFLRRAGWGVRVAPSTSEAQLIDIVGSERVEVVGISVSNTDLLAPLVRFVAAIRKASLNRDLIVIIGGSQVLAEHADQIGATFFSDPREAVRWLDTHAKLSP